jgi:membrane protein DedA with SNARE-associated domain
MNETIQFLTRHGYILLIGVVLARQACLPIPAGLFFVAAGALSRLGTFSLSGTLGLSIMTFLVADLAWYAAGREFGDRILHFVCGLSRSPVSCVHKATDTFANNRVRMLLFSKFVVGLDAIAAPLAGAACLSPVKFLVLDALGALFWTMTYVGLGYVFSDQLDRVATHIGQTGTLVALAAAVGFCVYLLLKLARWLRFLRQFNLERITPEQLRDQLNAGEDVLLVAGLLYPARFALIRAGLRNTGTCKFRHLRRSSSTVIAPANSRAPASRSRCGGTASSTFGRSPAVCGDGVSAAFR